jgi:hypothetical protein
MIDFWRAKKSFFCVCDKSFVALQEVLSHRKFFLPPNNYFVAQEEEFLSHDA